MRALKTLVILMAILIAAGAGIIAVTLYKRASFRLEATETAPAAAEKIAAPEKHGFGTQHVELPEGAHLDDLTTSGNRMILKLRLADGSPRLIVVDLDSGATLGEFDFGP